LTYALCKGDQLRVMDGYRLTIGVQVARSHARLLEREHQVRPDQPALILDADRNVTVPGLRDLPTHEQQA
jgi:hypothetical protein